MRGTKRTVSGKRVSPDQSNSYALKIPLGFPSSFLPVIGEMRYDFKNRRIRSPFLALIAPLEVSRNAWKRALSYVGSWMQVRTFFEPIFHFAPCFSLPFSLSLSLFPLLIVFSLLSLSLFFLRPSFPRSDEIPRESAWNAICKNSPRSILFHCANKRYLPVVIVGSSNSEISLNLEEHESFESVTFKCSETPYPWIRAIFVLLNVTLSAHYFCTNTFESSRCDILERILLQGSIP